MKFALLYSTGSRSFNNTGISYLKIGAASWISWNILYLRARSAVSWSKNKSCSYWRFK